MGLEGFRRHLLMLSCCVIDYSCTTCIAPKQSLHLEYPVVYNGMYDGHQVNKDPVNDVSNDQTTGP